jgi:dienelactone hydrolase
MRRFTTLLVLAAAPLAAQSPDASFGYLTLLGADTIGVERIQVRDQVWTGDIISRGQGRLIWSAAEVAPRVFSALDLAAYRTNTDDTPFQRVTLGMDGDTARLSIIHPRVVEQRLPSRRGAIVLINSSLAQIIHLAGGRASGARDTLLVFLASGGQTLPASIHRDGDTTRVTIAGVQTVLRHDANGTVVEGSIPAQGVRIVRVEGNALSAVTLGAPSYDAPSGAPYRAEQVTINAGTHTLAATFTRPREGAGPFPVVVTISGSGPQDRDEFIPVANGYRPFRQLADTLGHHDVAVLRFDDRGTGASTGDHNAATSADFADDVRAVIRWLRGRPDVASEHIVLLGHSEGAMIAPMVAATDARLRGIILMAGPSQNGRDIILYQQRYAIDRDSTLTTLAARDSAAAVARATYDSIVPTRPWWQFFATHDPLATARTVRAPALILHGETDRQVTAEQAEQLAAALREGRSRDVTVRVFPGLNHLFLYDPDGSPANYPRLPSGTIGPDVMGTIIDWLTTRVR